MFVVCKNQDGGGESALKIAGKNSYYKFFWKRDDSCSVGVQILVAKK